MKFSTRALCKVSAFAVAVLMANGCGNATELLNKLDESKDQAASSTSSESDSQNLIDGSLSAASGMADPQFKPYRLDGLEPDGRGHGPEGHRDGGGRGHHKGPRGDEGHGKGGHGKPPALPEEIANLMKSADAKKDTVLGIDRTKVEPIIKAMQTDLEVLRSVAGTREVFLAKAKEIQDKYQAQLKAVLPAFDSLTQEQKDRVKAIHDLQKKMLDSCVARGADATSAACTTAKSDLKANIDAP